MRAHTSGLTAGVSNEDSCEGAGSVRASDPETEEEEGKGLKHYGLPAYRIPFL